MGSVGGLLAMPWGLGVSGMAGGLSLLSILQVEVLDCVPSSLYPPVRGLGTGDPSSLYVEPLVRVLGRGGGGLRRFPVLGGEGSNGTGGSGACRCFCGSGIWGGDLGSNKGVAEASGLAGKVPPLEGTLGVL